MVVHGCSIMMGWYGDGEVGVECAVDISALA